MNRSEADRLGERLRERVTPQDLTLLDAYRRGFGAAYEQVVGRVQAEVGVPVSGRPAKSTTAIVDKLRRGTMRLSQMQDIAGCRIIVPGVPEQDELVARLVGMFEAQAIDRRTNPSHGYRAVHVIARVEEVPVEIQVRSELQHLWAETSEKLADRFGIALKYGGGPATIRNLLDNCTKLVLDYETWMEPHFRSRQDAQAFREELAFAIKQLADEADNLP